MEFPRTGAIIDNLTESRKIPSISAAVDIDGEPAFLKAAGQIFEDQSPINEETQFDIASVTKVFSGICFMQMVEEGRFSLDEPVCEVFPQLGGKEAD